MRHRDGCECDVCHNKRLPYWKQEEILNQKNEEFRERCRSLEKAQVLFDFLEIPYHPA